MGLPKAQAPNGPCVFYAVAKAVRKSEDFFLAVPSQPWPSTSEENVSASTEAYGLYAIVDGHNGRMAGEYVCELVADVFQELLERELGKGHPADVAIGQALCETFIVLDRRVTEKYTFSGCTLSLLIQHGWDLHVGSVGDSRALVFDGSATLQLTYDFRVEDSARERDRITQTGATIGRLAVNGRGPQETGEAGCGPMRVWPGGLCLSRAIGDPDVGHCILPHPFYKHVRVPGKPVRVLLATDGVWDAVTNQVAVTALRDLNTEAACTELVDLAISRRGLRDDTTVIVVDLTPSGESVAKVWGARAASEGGGLCGLCAPTGPRPSSSAGKGVEELTEMDFYTPAPVVAAKAHRLTAEGPSGASQQQPQAGVVGAGAAAKDYRKPAPLQPAGGVVALTVPTEMLGTPVQNSDHLVTAAARAAQAERGPTDEDGLSSSDEDLTVRGGNKNGVTAAQLLAAAAAAPSGAAPDGGPAALASVSSSDSGSADGSSANGKEKNKGAHAMTSAGSFAMPTCPDGEIEGSIKAAALAAALIASSATAPAP